MKNAKLIKYIMFSLFALLFFNITKVSALTASDFEMECIYDNGIAITAYYTDGNYGLSSSDVKISNAITPPYNTALTVFYKESSFAKEIIDSATCPEKISYMVVEQTAGDNKVTFQVYFRVTDTNYFVTSNSEYDEEFFKRKHVVGFDAESGTMMGFSIPTDSPLSKRVNLHWIYSDNGKYDEADEAISFNFNLVAERIYFNTDVTANKQWAFKSEGTQAASNPTYIRVYEYTTPNNSNMYVGEKGNTITKLSNTSINAHDDSKTIFACFKPSVKEIDTEKTDMAYKFTGVRHDLTIKGTKQNSEVVEGTNGYQCSTGYSLYREVNWDEAAEEEESATSICDVLPETSLLIAKIINYARILVPAILIILTAIDITKIVLTGEIEEELPKRRKLIITRFIIAAVFFFLPIFVQLFISSSYGIDFGDISCLW